MKKPSVLKVARLLHSANAYCMLLTTVLPSGAKSMEVILLPRNMEFMLLRLGDLKDVNEMLSNELFLNMLAVVIRAFPLKALAFSVVAPENPLNISAIVVTDVVSKLFMLMLFAQLDANMELISVTEWVSIPSRAIV